MSERVYVADLCEHGWVLDLQLNEDEPKLMLGGQEDPLNPWTYRGGTMTCGKCGHVCSVRALPARPANEVLSEAADWLDAHAETDEDNHGVGDTSREKRDLAAQLRALAAGPLPRGWMLVNYTSRGRCLVVNDVEGGWAGRCEETPGQDDYREFLDEGCFETLEEACAEGDRVRMEWNEVEKDEEPEAAGPMAEDYEAALTGLQTAGLVHSGTAWDVAQWMRNRARELAEARERNEA